MREWIAVFCFFSAFSGHAADLSSEEKTNLQAAQNFVKEFLEQDANPKEVYFSRNPKPDLPRDYPSIDCGLKGVVVAIEQRGQARYDNKHDGTVLVPVVAELIMLDAQGDGGSGAQPGMKGKSWCSFLPQRYNFRTGVFERVEDLAQVEFRVAFKTWGEYLYEWRLVPAPPQFPRNIYVSVDPQMRHIKYDIAIRFKDRKPYRTAP